MTAAQSRGLVVDYLRRQLIGPLADDPTEQLGEQPTDRYMTGILYPIRLPDEDLEAPVAEDGQDAEEPEDAGGQLLDPEDDDPVALSGQLRPSSAGLTFVTSDYGPITVDLAFGRYQGDDHHWHRRPGGDDGIEMSPDASGEDAIDIERDVQLRARWRPLGDVAIVTVVVVNCREQAPRRRVDPGDCLFQVRMRCSPREGMLVPYPAKSRWHRDQEAEEIELQYREVPVYAVGHGTAAEWDESESTPAWVGTTFLPSYTVPDVSFEVETDSPVFSMLHLSRIDRNPSEVLADLESFAEDYETWAATSRSTVTSVPERLRPAAIRLVERMEVAGGRMRQGIARLRDDRRARRAFALANLAMLMQIVHSRDHLAGTVHSVPDAPEMPVGQYEDPAVSWRPFQLAFLLLTIDGVVDDSNSDRDLVDLIWFPTGGGKTEAYLGLAAFTIFHRRLTDPFEDTGTAVITRYTLRLLTTQQFQRASTMILACDRIRALHENELGTTPFSIGVWVGGSSTPNDYAKAKELFRKLERGDKPAESFQVDRCPWCGTSLIPEDDPGGEWGIEVDNNSIRFRCLNRHCDFADRIPISSVDSHLYEHPPTMLIGTVDKFARLVWEPRAGVFLGAGGHPGPSLIIQDEFHLISGPLGTVVGLYEAAFDVAMRNHGARPKIVAATATIRRSDEQARGVFGREVALFPPAGLEAGESFFVHRDTTKPGRQYIGAMPQGHTPVRGMVMLASALLQAPLDVDLDSGTADGYWTLLAYHNSLRELGKTRNLAHDDLPSRIEQIARDEDHRRQLDNVAELTSRVNPVDIPRVLDRLDSPRGSADAIDMVVATNMFSVGVDVSRLGLMVVNGQPKTTAEYIQATSRVGRNSKRSPGLVATLYSPSKPRDRSHYESFTAYHSMLYSAVEPTSVTPFSVMARQRALHADLVILVRHVLGLADNADAAKFDRSEPQLLDLVRQLVERASRADESEAERVRSHLDALTREWERRAVDADPDEPLVYKGGSDGRGLLKAFLTPGDAWPTLDSMRSVDREIRVDVRGARR
jgi:hypothetical protein